MKTINHGDLYAHNILVNSNGHALYGDFGAATFYTAVSTAEKSLLERIEVRAFGCLLDDLLRYLVQEGRDTNYINLLLKLREDCFDANIPSRPTFGEILDVLGDVENSILKTL